MYRSAAAVQAVQVSLSDTQEDRQEEELVLPEDTLPVELRGASNGKLDVSELKIETDFPLDITARSSPKTSLGNIDEFMDFTGERPSSPPNAGKCISQSRHKMLCSRMRQGKLPDLF